jgi:Lar family restriction alleviation protein
MPEKLKPCPFCGNKNDDEEKYFDDLQIMKKIGSIYTQVFVFCPLCETQGPRRLTKKAAIEAWNRRYGEGK